MEKLDLLFCSLACSLSNAKMPNGSRFMLFYYSRGERGQVVKAVDCDSTIRGFKSRRSPLIFIL